MIEATLSLVEAGRDLSMDQMSQTLGMIMEGKCSEEEIARLLVALHQKGETVAEVAGAAPWGGWAAAGSSPPSAWGTFAAPPSGSSFPGVWEPWSGIGMEPRPGGRTCSPSVSPDL